jgi:hypothetical protein
MMRRDSRGTTAFLRCACGLARGATLYGDRNFRGATLQIVEDVRDVDALSGPCSGSYNDCISSIRVYRR